MPLATHAALKFPKNFPGTLEVRFFGQKFSFCINTGKIYEVPDFSIGFFLLPGGFCFYIVVGKSEGFRIEYLFLSVRFLPELCSDVDF